MARGVMGPVAPLTRTGRSVSGWTGTKNALGASRGRAPSVIRQGPHAVTAPTHWDGRSRSVHWAAWLGRRRAPASTAGVARRTDRDPVVGKLPDQRVHRFLAGSPSPGTAAARRRTSFSCSSNRTRLRSSRFSACSSPPRTVANQPGAVGVNGCRSRRLCCSGEARSGRTRADESRPPDIGGWASLLSSGYPPARGWYLR